MITCQKTYTDIPFAHRQQNHDGHCKYIHGHNWEFTFEFGAESLDENNFIIDFGKLKWLKQWLEERFDHKLVLNESDPWLAHLTNVLQGLNMETGGEPTFPECPMFADITIVPDASVEGLAKWVYENVNRILHEQTLGRVYLVSVKVMEDSRNGATYHL